jgi:protein-S-isoprenylcysteine O-methyltransferase Ste14
MWNAEAADSSCSHRQGPLFWAYSILMFLPIILVFIFYGLGFLVYAGWILVVCSMVIILTADAKFRKAGGALKGERLVHTTVLVDSGVHAVVRHPQYLGFMLFVEALVLMSQHWASVASGAAGSALISRAVLRQEQMSVEKLRDAYKRHRDIAPRMNLGVGILRLRRKRRKPHTQS